MEAKNQEEEIGSRSQEEERNVGLGHNAQIADMGIPEQGNVSCYLLLVSLGKQGAVCIFSEITPVLSCLLYATNLSFSQSQLCPEFG